MKFKRASADFVLPVQKHQIWLNEDETVGVRLWENGTMELMTRSNRHDMWSPPIELKAKA